jgi:hypothetical protein
MLYTVLFITDIDSQTASLTSVMDTVIGFVSNLSSIEFQEGHSHEIDKVAEELRASWTLSSRYF